MSSLSWLGLALIGLCWIMVLLWKQRSLRAEAASSERRAAIFSERLALQLTVSENNNRLKEELQILQQRYAELCTEHAVLKAQGHERETGLQEKLAWMEKAEQRLSATADAIFKKSIQEREQHVQQQGKEVLQQTISPLKCQLELFHKQIQDHFSCESKERHTLTQELKKLQTLNVQLAEDAIALTNALKGNQKSQGCWGEMVLAHVLEASGLREGHEYALQVNVQGVEGKIQPDALLYLPQDKVVIIDAKLSLLAYERYCRSECVQTRKEALGAHLASLRQHIKTLSKKEYQNAPSLRTLDYVLLFIPIEGAFALAIEHAPDLLQQAQAHQLMLVSPTTLLTTLRAIHMVWQTAQQEHNAKQIAQRAASLYDKFRLLMDALQEVEQGLTRAKQGYHEAMNRLCFGKGNLIRQVEGFRALGVTVKKTLAPALVEEEMLALADDANLPS